MMRVFLFDGILETHVVESFRTALELRGHDVLSTGKIGHGFQFPSSYDGIVHLQLAVRRALDWEPDWVFVFRPASLPIFLLNELRAAGVKVAAWFSDDPVLFNLSYGPVLDAYDLVLHCGNARVLEFYESRFGRPTGVNFPFWTDEHHFPYVWGSEEPESDLLFLGNVGDKVRRGRYFDLAKIKSSLRIHGNVGADYFHLSGGYLDSDAEVVNAGSRTLAALNIPQYFRDHFGLETWFSELGTLGFFEYPSRVVQYMAMGIPVLSVIEGSPEFVTFPEMLVVPSIAEVDKQLEQLRDMSAARELSMRTHTRFKRHFTADSRVRVFERLVEDDSWKALPARARVSWFSHVIDESHHKEALEGRAEEASLTSRRESKVVITEDRQRLFDAGPASAAPPQDVAYVVGTGWTRPLSRIVQVCQALEDLGIKVERVNPASRRELFEPGGPEGFKYTFNEEALLNTVQGARWMLIVDYSVAIPDGAANVLSRTGTGTFVWVPSARRWDDQCRAAADMYDVVGLSHRDDVKRAAGEGFENVTLTPDIIDSRFREELSTTDGDDFPAIKWFTANWAADDALSSLRLSDLAGVPWEDLRALAEDTSVTYADLKEKLRCGVAVVSHAGTRTHPRLSELVPYVVAAADICFFVRAGGEDSLAPYADNVLLVRERGELSRKLWRISESRDLFEHVRAGKRRLVEGILDARVQVSRVLASVDDAVLSRVRSETSDQLRPVFSAGGWTRRIELSDIVRDGSRPADVRIRMVDRLVPGSTCRVRVEGPNEDLFVGTVGDDGLHLTVGASQAGYAALSIVIEWSDISRRVARSALPRVAVTADEHLHSARTTQHLTTPWVIRAL